MTRKLSIITGLILFLFVSTHLLNLTAGLISLEVLESVRPYFFMGWNHPVGFAILASSILIHILLALYSIYRRNTLRMSSQDKVQLFMALLIIPLLIPHTIAIFGGENVLGIKPSFPGFLKLIWIDSPSEGLRQVLLLVVVWIHGCIGLFTWLRLKSWWLSVAPYTYPLAVVIPVLALLGFVEAGRETVEIHKVDQEVTEYNSSYNSGYSSSYNSPDSSYRSSYEPSYDSPKQPGYSSNYDSTYENTADGYEVDGYGDGYGDSSAIVLTAEEFEEKVTELIRFQWFAIFAYFGLIVLVFAARYFRLRAYNETVEIHYADGEIITADVGLSLLEIAIQNDIPHASLCHGRGRCGTCRVRIFESSSELSPPSTLETAMLERLGSSPDMRLACQLGPGPGVIRLERLLPADFKPEDLRNPPPEDNANVEIENTEQNTNLSQEVVR